MSATRHPFTIRFHLLLTIAPKRAVTARPVM